MAKKSKSRASGVRAIVGRSYDSAVPDWIDTVRRFADQTDHIINKWEPRAVWLSHAYLKQAREEIQNFSQHDLAEATSISRSVIANYESDVTGLTWEAAIKVYGVLQGLGSESATKAMLNITEIDKEISVATLNLLDGRRSDLKAHVAKCEAEEERLKAKLGR